MIPALRSSRGAPLPSLLALLVFLASTLGLPAAHAFATTISTISQVKDINRKSTSSNPANLINVNGTLFFTATDSSHGVALWESDGTAAGTVLAKDINPGKANSSPGDLTAVNGTLFFTADDGSSGRELWRQVSLTVWGYVP